jgi:hypothetical protein
MQRMRAKRWTGLIALLALVGALLHSAAACAAETEKSRFQYYADRTFDAALVRPVGMIAVLVGAGLFVPAAALTSPGGMDPINEALEFFVLEPSHYVFQRPLGEF